MVNLDIYMLRFNSMGPRHSINILNGTNGGPSMSDFSLLFYLSDDVVNLVTVRDRISFDAFMLICCHGNNAVP